MDTITRTLRALGSRPWLVMPLVALVALAGWWLWRTTTDSTSAAADIGTQVTAVTQGPLDQVVTSQGTVTVAEQQDAAFSSSGTVTAVNVTAGQTVTAGQVMATLDSAELEAAVTEAEASVADAEAQLSDDRSAGASDAQLEADETSLTSAQDRLTEAQEALAGAQLVAEFAGTVASVDLTVGEQLGSSGTGSTTMTGSGSGSGGSSATLGDSGGTTGIPGATGATGATSGTGTTTSTAAQIVVVSSSSYVVELSLDADDVAELEVGQPAEVTLVSSTSSASGLPGGGAFPGGGGFPGGGAFPGGGSGAATGDQDAEDAGPPGQITGTSAAEGTVTEVSQVADASSGVARYTVTVSFTDDSGDYNAGASVSVDIVYASTADDTLSVPVRAVTTANGISTVEVSTGEDSSESRQVTTGDTVDGQVEITSGLEAGESVVMSGLGGLGGLGTPGGGGAGGLVTDGGGPTGQMPDGSDADAAGGQR